MKGSELASWRKLHGYSQEKLMGELDVGSRQTVSNWENSQGDIPRIVELALIALERAPECRRIAGKRSAARDRRNYFKDGDS